MDSQGAHREPLHISSLDEFARHEADIVRRVNTRTNGGQLLLIDPIRLLREVGVTFTDDALREIQERGGISFGHHSASARAYAAVAGAPRNDRARILVRGLLTDRSSWR
jgi:hypothetical protein